MMRIVLLSLAFACTHATQSAEIAYETGNVWKNIQNDAIVQIFAQQALIDLLQPYRTPDSMMVRGSGFFILYNGQIYVVTNAHVVEQAFAVWIQIPSLGKQLIRMDIVSEYPEKDFALLAINEQNISAVLDAFNGSIPYLELGDSSTVRRTDQALALGYPLGQESLKSTLGIVSGREFAKGSKMIQIDTAMNPGNSGGPLLDEQGFVIGINAAGVINADGVNYAIPINDFKKSLPKMCTNQLVRKPFLGVLTHKVDDYVTQFLGNPIPGGCYVTEVANNSPLAQVGVQQDDMIYEVNGHKVDVYGDMFVEWSQDKISIVDYISQLGIGEQVHLVIYRNGQRLEFNFNAEFVDISPIKRIFPWYEVPEYEVFAGMVITPLTQNHIGLLGNSVPGLRRYSIFNAQDEPALLISHIFPNSQLACTRAMFDGYTLKAVNGIEVYTLDDFRAAIQESKKTGIIHIRACDEITASTDNIVAVLPYEPMIAETFELAHMYHYPISEFVQGLGQELMEAQG